MNARRKTVRALMAVVLLTVAGKSFGDGTAETPDEFLPWVESTGTQYIDTGIEGKTGFKSEVEYSWTSAKQDACVLGSRKDDGDTRCYAVFGSGSGYVGFGFGVYASITALKLNSRLRAITETNGRRCTQTFSDVQKNASDSYAPHQYTPVTVDSGNDSFTSGLNMYLFAANKGGTAAFYSHVRLYGAKIWMDGELVRDFRPCQKDGRAGLYDEVSKKIFYPAQGFLIYSAFPDALVDYVETDGTQYVDSGVMAKTGLRAESEVSFKDLSTDNSILAAYDSTKRFMDVFCVHADVNGIYDLHGTGWEHGMPDTAQGIYVNVLRDKKPLTTGARYRMGCDYQLMSQTAWYTNVNDTANSWSTCRVPSVAAQDFDTGCNLYVFARNDAGTPNYKSPAYVSWLKIYVNGTLERNFLPCVISGAKGSAPNGLYDSVHGTIHPLDGAPYAGTPSVVYSADEAKYNYPLESDGMHWVDTGVRGKRGVSIETHARWTTKLTSTTDQCLVGSTGNGVQCNLLHRYSEGFWVRYGDKSGMRLATGDRKSAAPPAGGDGWFQYDISIAAEDFHAHAYSESGGLTLYGDLGGELSPGGTLYVCANHDMGTSSAKFLAKAKLYGLKIWDGETLVRDYVPCRKGSSYCLFDKATGIIYPSATASAFAGGADTAVVGVANRVRYVETRESQYVDTFIRPSSSGNVKMQTRMQWAQLDNADHAFCASRGDDSNSRLYLLEMCYGAVYGGFGTYLRVDGTPMACDTWYDFVSEYVGRSFSFSINSANYSVTIPEGGQPSDGYSLYLSACNWQNLPTLYGAVRIGRTKLWVDGVLKGDYQPVMTTVGIAALYNRISQRLVPLATGFFAAVGEDCGPLDRGLLITVE